MIRGRVGDPEADGWVAWTTEDEGLSYVPALHCGEFSLVLEDKTLCVHYDDEQAVADGGSGTCVVNPWNMRRFQGAAVYLAAVQEHPNIGNVYRAAGELWEALESPERLKKECEMLRKRLADLERERTTYVEATSPVSIDSMDTILTMPSVVSEQTVRINGRVLREILAGAKETHIRLACQHPLSHMRHAGNENIHWCSRCGALKVGQVHPWTRPFA
jgi:hypothetical protein